MKSKKKSKKPKTRYVPKYWQCVDCAVDKDMSLPVNYVGTVLVGFCGWCKIKKEVTLIPMCDFNGPNQRAIFD